MKTLRQLNDKQLRMMLFSFQQRKYPRSAPQYFRMFKIELRLLDEVRRRKHARALKRMGL